MQNCKTERKCRRHHKNRNQNNRPHRQVKPKSKPKKNTTRIWHAPISISTPCLQSLHSISFYFHIPYCKFHIASCILNIEYWILDIDCLILDRAYVSISKKLIRESLFDLRLASLILIKNVSYSDMLTQSLTLTSSSNVLLIPPYSLLSQHFLNNLTLFTTHSDVDHYILTPFYANPQCVAQIPTQYTNMHPVSLANVFVNHWARNQATFRVKVFVIEIGPTDLKEWTKAYCQTCLKM